MPIDLVKPLIETAEGRGQKAEAQPELEPASENGLPEGS
jgi:hypothetical protein